MTSCSAGTGSLFRSIRVSDIAIDLRWFEPESAQTSSGQDAQRVVVTAFLDVDIDGGATTLRINNEQQIFFFAPGNPAEGEDPDRLYIVEWRDVGATAKPGLAVENTTWGSIKQFSGE